MGWQGAVEWMVAWGDGSWGSSFGSENQKPNRTEPNRAVLTYTVRVRRRETDPIGLGGVGRKLRSVLGPRASVLLIELCFVAAWVAQRFEVRTCNSCGPLDICLHTPCQGYLHDRFLSSSTSCSGPGWSQSKGWARSGGKDALKVSSENKRQCYCPLLFPSRWTSQWSDQTDVGDLPKTFTQTTNRKDKPTRGLMSLIQIILRKVAGLCSIYVLDNHAQFEFWGTFGGPSFLLGEPDAKIKDAAAIRPGWRI